MNWKSVTGILLGIGAITWVVLVAVRLSKTDPNALELREAKNNAEYYLKNNFDWVLEWRELDNDAHKEWILFYNLERLKNPYVNGSVIKEGLAFDHPIWGEIANLHVHEPLVFVRRDRVVGKGLNILDYIRPVAKLKSTQKTVEKWDGDKVFQENARKVLKGYNNHDGLPVKPYAHK